MTQVDSDLQRLTYQMYMQLVSLQASWAGHLILGITLDHDGQALALASIAAGAAILMVDGDPQRCRDAMRVGACDFVVNTVDEALRVLKNELRTQAALSVALQLESAAALSELLARGVQPALFVAKTATYQSSQSLPSILHGPCDTFTFSTGAELREFDRKLKLTFGAEDPRFRWVEAASRLFYRDRSRSLRLTEAEKQRISTSA